MNSRPINLGLRCHSAGSPVLVDKIDGVLELEWHEHGAWRSWPSRRLEISVETIDRKIGALKKRRIRAALAQEPQRIGP